MTRSGDNPDKVKLKKESVKTKPKVVETRKKRSPSVSKETLSKKVPLKEKSVVNEGNPVEVKAKQEKKVPSKNNKRKEKGTSSDNSSAGRVLNGSLSEKKTGDIYLGFHASSAGGVHHAITDSVSVGARSLALFLRPQRTWSAPPLKPQAIELFRRLREEEQLLTNMILPHGSYLLNLGSPDPEQRGKSLELLVDELERCQTLGLILFNIHPGWTNYISSV